MDLLKAKRVWAGPAALVIGVAVGAFGAARPAIGAATVKVAGLTCTVKGTVGNDILRGTAARDVICGLGGNDLLFGLGGDDVLFGGSGNDVMVGGAGADRLVGGLGSDAASWSDRRGGVTATLDGVANDGAANERDDAGTDVEDLIGGAGPDVLVGDGKPNKIKGQGGSDSLNGGSGEDVLIGGDGDNTIDGGDDPDVISCGSGIATLIAGFGDTQKLDCRKAIRRMPIFTGTVTTVDAEAGTVAIAPGPVSLEPWVSTDRAQELIDRVAADAGGEIGIVFTTRFASVLRMVGGSLQVGDEVLVTAVERSGDELVALAIVALPTGTD